MYEFHYDHIRNKYLNKSRLPFTDTDSLMYKIENVYDDFRKNKEMLNFGNYPKKSKYQDDSNKLFVGKKKDEICGVKNLLD